MKKLGCVNATSQAIAYDDKNKVIAYCMDTPNNIAYLMATNTNVAKVKTPYNGKYTRADLQDRFSWIVRDAEYHKPYIQMV